MALSKSVNLTSDEFQDATSPYCQPCRLDNKQELAYGECQTCSEHLCEECFNIHTRPTPLRNHILSKPAGSVKSITCAQHEGNTLDLLCKSHNVVCCRLCVKLYHQKCEIVKISDISKDFVSSDKYQGMLLRIERVKDDCKNVLKLEKELDKIDANKEKIRTEIETVKKKTKDQIETSEKELYAENDRRHGSQIEDVNKLVSESTELLQKAKQLQDNFKKIQATGNNNRLCTHAMQSEDTLVDIEKRAKRNKQYRLDENYFSPNRFTDLKLGCLRSRQEQEEELKELEAWAS